MNNPQLPLALLDESEVQEKVAAKRLLVEEMAGSEAALSSHSHSHSHKPGYHGSIKQSREEREKKFWSLVSIKPNGCWEWKACTVSFRSKEYGRFHFESSGRLAHRVSWELTFGSIPAGLNVLHKCDVGLCVRPDHLFLGTQLDNVRDMHEKGRGKKVCGEKHPRAKLTESKVKELRAIAKLGRHCYRELGEIFGISLPTAMDVVKRRSWKHI